MESWGCCHTVLGAHHLLASREHRSKPRRRPICHLAHVRQAYHAVQLTLREGVCAHIPGLLAPPHSSSSGVSCEAAEPPPRRGGGGSNGDPGHCWQAIPRAALALLASVCLHMGGSAGAAYALNVPSAAEDKLLELVRVLESKLDTAAQMAGEAVGSLAGAPSPGDQAAAPSSAERWRALVCDVWEVVDANFMDARSTGFSRERWAQLRDEALAQPLNSRAAAHGAIRGMVARGLRDPYSRFITPSEFSAMLKYDVSGVGLNLGTAEEFVNKTGFPLPGYDPPSSSASSSRSAPDSLASGSECGGNSDSKPAAPSLTPVAGAAAAAVAPADASPSSASASTAPSTGGGSSGSSSSSREGSASGGGIFIVGLISGSAADQAGLQQGDELLSLGGSSLGGRTPFEVASLLAGGQDEAEDGAAPGGKQQAQQQQGLGESLGLTQKPVQLEVRKYGSGEVVSVELQRVARVLPSPVTSRLERQGAGPLGLPLRLPGSPLLPQLSGSITAAAGREGQQQQPGAVAAEAVPPANEGGGSGSGSGAAATSGDELVGYIKLSSFNARAQRDLAAAVKRLEAQGAARFVLDLRDNRGGLVSEGIEVARLFLDDDALVVRTEGKAKASAAPITAAGPALTTAPLVVLVNEHTASASEILAGALQDNCRAVLAGKQTYGKGLIQSVYELEDGSGLVLTVGKYVTPRGTDIDREGIRPQFKAVPSPAAAQGAIQACRLTPPTQPLIAAR